MKNNWLRKIMMISAMAAFGLLAGCNTDDVSYDKAQIVATPAEVEIKSGSADPVTEPESVTFEIDATRSWTMAPHANDWLIITSVDGKPESGGAGKKVLMATAKINDTPRSRTADIIFYIDYRTSTTVKFNQKAENEVPVGKLLYSENMGAVGVASNTYIADHTGWSKTGDGATNVTYSGVNATVRTSTPSVDYEGASGGNNIFFGALPTDFVISKINVTGETNVVLKFGVQQFSTVIASNTITLSASVNGTDWTVLTYDNTTANAGKWALATTSFSVPSGTTELYIKYDNPIAASAVRVDDVVLNAGGSGGVVVGVPAPTVTASAATAVGETTATIGGTFTAPAGVTATEAGVEWKKTADATFTKVPVAGAATGVAFTHDLTGLVKGTSYTYRAYATTADGTTYSGEATFTTTDPGRVYKTIADLRAYPTGVAITDNAYVKGIVIGVGNSVSFKNIVIQDDTGGILFRSDDNYNGSADGDEIEVLITGVTLSRYQDIGALQGAVKLASITKLSSGNPVVATDITAEELITGAFESRYVAVSGVQVVGEDLGKTVGGTAHTSIKMETATESFVMFSSSYTSFKGENVPQGSGVLKGVASTSGGIYQIMPTVATDFSAMTGPRFGGVSFGAVEFEGMLKATEAVPAGAMIKVPYFTAKGTEVFNVTVASTDTGITIADMTATLAAGDGFIEIPVAGTPAAAVEVTFTINGITGLTANTVKATIWPAGSAGQVFTSNVTLPTTNSTAESHYAHFASVDGVGAYNALKFGTGSKPGTYTTPALPLTGSMTLSFTGVAWKGTATTDLTITVNSAGTIDGAAFKTFVLQPNDGLTGGGGQTGLPANLGTTADLPYPLAEVADDYYTVQLEGVTAATTLTIATGKGNRAALVGINVTQ